MDYSIAPDDPRFTKCQPEIEPGDGASYVAKGFVAKSLQQMINKSLELESVIKSVTNVAHIQDNNLNLNTKYITVFIEETCIVKAKTT